MKSTIVVAVILFMAALLATPAAVQAQFSYTTNADGISVTITGYTGPPWAVTIPTNINGLPVTTIGEDAFRALAITSVTIPGSVASIGNSAFSGCFSLTNATILNGVTSIGDGAFGDCWRLTILRLPGSVTNIGDSAFGACTGLTNVTLPGSLTSTGNSVFEDCHGLTSITIPGSVTNIGNSAFSGCYRLTSVTIPGSVTSIGESAFYMCEDLTSVTLPGSVTSLGDYAFAQCNSLISVYFTGNAPTADSSLFIGTLGPVLGPTVYYLPSTTGWSNSFAGRPALLWNPLIQTGDGSFGVRNNQFGFNITGTTNIPIVVEACSNLASSVWTPLQSLTLTNGCYYFSEPFQPGSSGRFYRISSQ